ncbi:nucleotidyltransferase AbiEii toxin of type IV toxin-antitoxin system [Rhizobium sp. PP-WC-1G-195]|nr:nucleotidyltransferase AbiEii toxin of type IV toxin-antitoxin system [Rhizobium sp. PP-WC-1G-195]
MDGVYETIPWNETAKRLESLLTSYETARPSTLRLLPSEARIKDLRADYRAMAPMMFDESPRPFDEILAKVAVLEETVNK